MGAGRSDSEKGEWGDAWLYIERRVRHNRFFILEKGNAIYLCSFKLSYSPANELAGLILGLRAPIVYSPGKWCSPRCSRDPKLKQPGSHNSTVDSVFAELFFTNDRYL